MDKPKIMKLLDELDEYAYDIRCDWSEFDGRSLLYYVRDWIKQMKNALELR